MVLAVLGIALALHCKRVVGRALNVAEIPTSIFMNLAAAAGRNWRTVSRRGIAEQVAGRIRETALWLPGAAKPGDNDEAGEARFAEAERVMTDWTPRWRSLPLRAADGLLVPQRLLPREPTTAAMEFPEQPRAAQRGGGRPRLWACESCSARVTMPRHPGGGASSRGQLAAGADRAASADGLFRE